uniref:Uncharacterized protein n=1 Tax=Anguilla anguilla TaxID=7936 RepID=A0A0E9W231_ANGAN
MVYISGSLKHSGRVLLHLWPLWKNFSRQERHELRGHKAMTNLRHV